MYSFMSLGLRAVLFQVKRFAVRHAMVLGALLFCPPFLALAQEANIVGTITDPSGLVVSDARITAFNMETSLTRTTSTNEAGQYVVPDLRIGNYTVKIEATGFKTIEQRDVVLNVGDRTRLDFQLQLGVASETVFVEAGAAHVQSDSGEISSVITGRQIAQLATDGRDIYSLAGLMPGASSQMSDFQVATPVGASSSISFNGLRQAHNIYLLDGGEDDDRGGGGGMSIAPSIDAIAEFRALTSDYSADYGLSSAGTMTMVLKSGTSALHASAWEFNRNDAFDARNFFNPVPQEVAKLRMNIFGFNVGGPVTFGKLYNPDKKKTFFFYNMELRRLVQGSLLNTTVPSPSTYGGDFGATTINVPSASQVSSSVLAKNCPGDVLPAGIVQGAAFPGNAIPSCMLDPNAQALLSAGIFPAPNNGNQFVGGNESPTNVREEIVRVDHNFSSKFAVFGHFIAEQISQNHPTTQFSGSNVPAVSDTFETPSYSGVTHTTFTISPTLLNEVAFNYNGNHIDIHANGIYQRPSSFDVPRLFPGPNVNNRIPAVYITGSTGTIYDASCWPWHNQASDYQIRDDLSWTKGSHQLRFGFSWALYKKAQDLCGETQGGFNFNGVYAGNDFADYLLGLGNIYTELGVQDRAFWNNVSWASYVQDNWRATRRLTLNLGLRWDGVPHTYEVNNRVSNFYPNLYNPADAATVLPNGTISPASPGLGTSPNPILAGYPLYLNGIGIPGQNGIPKGLVDNHWAAFGPRLGFAYGLTSNGKTVVRGGFGIMYERIQGNDIYGAGSNLPFSTSVTFNGVSLSNPNTSLLTGATLTAPITVASIVGLNRSLYDLPASYQFSVGIQRALNEGSVLSVAYVGNTNRHQSYYQENNLPPESDLPGLTNNTIPGGFNTVVPYPGFNSISLATNEANSHYNSLQVEFKSQVRHALTLHVAYTLSRAIDGGGASQLGSDGQDLGSVSNPYAGWLYDVGPSLYDRTNILLANLVYDLPFFRNSSSRFMKTALGGWTVSGVVVAESGLPINVGISGAQSFNGLPSATNRPDLSGRISYPHTVSTTLEQSIQWISPSAFLLPTLGGWGNLGYDAARGPGRDNWNLSLFKNFVLSEARGSRLELRVESFNTWNHTQFNAVSNNFGASNFGQVTSAFDPRVFQLGGKLYF
jgi:hypothetical protein